MSEVFKLTRLTTRFLLAQCLCFGYKFAEVNSGHWCKHVNAPIMSVTSDLKYVTQNRTTKIAYCETIYLLTVYQLSILICHTMHKHLDFFYL